MFYAVCLCHILCSRIEQTTELHVHNLKANGKEEKYLGLFSLNFMLNVQRGNALSYVTYLSESGRHIANRSPKGNMWSAIPVALLCMIVIGVRGSRAGPRRGRSPVEHRGTSVRPSVRSSFRPFVPPQI